MITIKKDLFLLSNTNYTYIFNLYNGKPMHVYFGMPVKDWELDIENENYLRKEFSEYCRGDFRTPSLVVKTSQSISTDFKFTHYKIEKTKPQLNMPALRGGEETLVVYLQDSLIGLELALYYTLYEEGICRRATLTNVGKETVTIKKFLSACFDFPMGNYEYLSLSGTHNYERNYNVNKVPNGLTSIYSNRGITSHQHAPFLALSSVGATETHGNVYGFNLIYSGNFVIELDKNEIFETRVCLGENLQYGGYPLQPNETFSTPEVVAVYSNNGYGEMSRLFHKLYRKNLINQKFVDKVRPVVINSWESVVFDFDESVLCDFIESAKGLGIDMVVLDDGWFGKRDSDNSSLGDWVVHKGKLKNGLTPIIDKCHACGMRFGLWFEPECISPDSDLYRAHPDWAIQTKGREGVLIRHQLVLDFSRKEVVDYVFSAMEKILTDNEIDYIKWDMNRALTDVPNAKLYHDYVLGVYDLYNRLTSAFPSLLIEGCASGGGRFDGGILSYSPMIWTSDNTDAWSRSIIQYSTSLCYPLQTMSNHVSDCPNIQTGRTISLKTRGHVASFGAFGYELHTQRLNDSEREVVKAQIETYKKDANTILTGDLYRLKNPNFDGAFSQIVVAEDGSKAVFVYLREKSKVNDFMEENVRLQGLNNDDYYLVEEFNKVYIGAQLMNAGLSLKLPKGDYQSVLLHIRKIVKD